MDSSAWLNGARGSRISPDGPWVAGALVDSRGVATLIPAPDGAEDIESPRTIDLPGGRAMMIWGRRTDTSRVRWPRVNELWAATYDGKGWTPKHRVVHGAIFSWQGGSRGAVLTFGERIVVIVGGYDNDAKPQPWTGILVSTFDGTWRTTRLTEFSMPAYLIAARGDNDEVKLLYTSTFGAAGSNQYGFIERQSKDGGQTWTDPRFVYPVRTGEDWPVLNHGTQGWNLVWLDHDQSATRQSSTFRRLHSANGGSWTAEPSLGLPFAVSAHTAIQDQPGNLRFAVTEPNGTVHIASLAGNRWTEPTPLSTRSLIGLPVFSLAGRDSVQLSLGIRYRAPGSRDSGGLAQAFVKRASSCQ